MGNDPVGGWFQLDLHLFVSRNLAPLVEPDRDGVSWLEYRPLGSGWEGDQDVGGDRVRDLRLLLVISEEDRLQSLE
jgi:hypothetical protein